MKNPTSFRDSGKVATCTCIHKSLSLFVIVTLCLLGTVESASKVRGRALGIGYSGRMDNDFTDVPPCSPRIADSISNDDPDEDAFIVIDGRMEDMASTSKATKGSKKSKSTKKSEKKLRKNDAKGCEEGVDGRVDDSTIDSEPTEGPSVSVTAPYSSSSPTIVNSSNPTVSPTTEPSGLPTGSPTVSPTAASTEAPTMAPTAPPTASPTVAPTMTPSMAPSAPPSEGATEVPSDLPTTVPTRGPTGSPTALDPPRASIATMAPSAAPSKLLKTAKSIGLIEGQKIHNNPKQTKVPILE